MSHDALLFNVHDLILLIAIAQYLLLATLLVLTRRPEERSGYWLAAILAVTALQATDTLIVWSPVLRYMLLESHPNLFFLATVSYWLEGPLMYWYVASVLYQGYRLHRKDLWHLVPALVMGGLFVWRYYLLPVEEKIALMANLDFMYSDFMAWIITTWHASVIGYGSACLLMLRRYRKELHHHYANLEGRTRGWLMWVISGFMLLAGWKLTVHLIGESLEGWLANSLGIASNYLTFAFVMSLVIISVRYAHLFAGLAVGTAEENPSQALKDENIERIHLAMEKDRFYLEPDVTLEALAKRVSLPERTTSRILNQHFSMNFFEFINSYRVEETKRLLTSEKHVDWTIMQVLLESGFTSKSTFNAIFKKQVGMTPSQYRKRVVQDRATPGVLPQETST